MDSAGLALTLSISATNPNSSDLTASDVSSKVVVQGQDVGTVTVPETLTLPAGKTTNIDVPVRVSWSDVTLLAELAASNSPVPYSVEGMLDLGGSLLHVSVPSASTAASRTSRSSARWCIDAHAAALRNAAHPRYIEGSHD